LLSCMYEASWFFEGLTPSTAKLGRRQAALSSLMVKPRTGVSTVGQSEGAHLRYLRDREIDMLLWILPRREVVSPSALKSLAPGVDAELFVLR